ncbi:MAG: beta-ketoacyl synthase chain length factor, partial [Myxococcales bacterium]|nr:beta-ketoacyl synthase chain length factor [Myxococcales bacterium]
ALVATVFGSTHGEIQIAVEQMQMMHEGDGKISPARFKNSVHNTGAGIYSIATRNKGFTTSIAGGWETFANSLLEAQALLTAGHERVIVAVADEPIPVAMDANFHFDGLGAALVLEREPDDAKVLGTLDDLRISEEPAPTPNLPDMIRRNPVGPGAGLVRAIKNREKGRIALTYRGDTHWDIQLR